MAELAKQKLASGGRIALIIILVGSVAYGSPLLPDFPSKSGPQPRPLPLGTRVRGYIAKHPCKFLLSLVGLAGLGGYGVYEHYLGAEIPDVLRGTEDLSDIETDQDDPPELFPNGSEESSFHFRLDTSAIPAISIFRKNNVQRSMSRAFHARQVAEEAGDPLRRPAADNSKDGVLAYLEGLTFHVTGDKKDQVEVTIHGNQTEAKLPGTVSRADLESGKEITLQFPAETHDLDGVGHARITGSITFRYVPEKRVILMNKATVNIGAKMWGLPAHDTGSFENLIGRRYPVRG